MLAYMQIYYYFCTILNIRYRELDNITGVEIDVPDISQCFAF